MRRAGEAQGRLPPREGGRKIRGLGEPLLLHRGAGERKRQDRLQSQLGEDRIRRHPETRIPKGAGEIRQGLDQKHRRIHVLRARCFSRSGTAASRRAAARSHDALSCALRMKVCSFKDCGRPTLAKGLCKLHYNQQRRGLPLTPERYRKSLAEKLEEGTIKGSGCWRWKGTHIKGRPKLSHGKSIFVYRVALELAVGPPPEGKPMACHKCGHRWCVNPDHLYWGDSRDNQHDFYETPEHVRENNICEYPGCGRPAKTKTHCLAHQEQLKKGKPLTPIQTREQRPEFCTFKDCNHPVIAKGLCSAHYNQQRQGKELKPRGYKEPKKVCSVEGCDRFVKAKGLCGPHYNRQRQGKELKPLPAPQPKVCTFNDCGRPAAAKGLCASHDWQLKHGKPLTPIKRQGKPSTTVGSEEARVCSVEGCGRKVAKKSFCRTHYEQQRIGKPLTPIRKHEPQPEFCTVEGCGLPARTKGLCGAHHMQLRRGEELKPVGYREPKPERAFEDCDRPAVGRKEYCRAHQNQLQRGKELKPLRDPLAPKPLCTFKDCGRLHSAKGLCQQHYNQLRQGKELTPVGQSRVKPLAEKLEEGTAKGSASECWRWTGQHVEGRPMLHHGKRLFAYRVALELAVGPPPEGKPQACHKCGNGWCVNPDHLYWGDSRDNQHDRYGTPDHARGREICEYPGCGRKVDAQGLCNTHRQHQLQGRPLTPIQARGEPQPEFCTVEGCGRPSNAKGLCITHRRMQRQGKPLTPISDPRPEFCTIEGCNRKHEANGLCGAHYQQQRQGKPLMPIQARGDPQPEFCTFKDCGRPPEAKGLCGAHYAQLRQGKELKPHRYPFAPKPLCSYEDCGRPARRKGLCSAHYGQQLRGKPLTPIRERKKPESSAARPEAKMH